MGFSGEAIGSCAVCPRKTACRLWLCSALDHGTSNRTLTEIIASRRRVINLTELGYLEAVVAVSSVFDMKRSPGQPGAKLLWLALGAAGYATTGSPNYRRPQAYQTCSPIRAIKPSVIFGGLCATDSIAFVPCG